MVFGMKHKRDAHIELSVFKHPIVSRPLSRIPALFCCQRVTPSRLQIVSSSPAATHYWLG